jgi:16S rRNA (cytosine967-C5)-methyltransferase
VSTGPRRLAVDALVRVESGAFTHLAVPAMLDRSGLAARDRAFVTGLVAGTVRMQRALDHQLQAVADRDLGALEPRVRAALRLGAYQLLSGVPAHAAVGETVAAVPERARGYVNGVLRALARAGPDWPWPEGDDIVALGVRTSHPDWIVALLVEQFGRDDALATLGLANEPPPVTLRARRRRTTTAALVAELAAAGVAARPHPLADTAVVCGPSGAPGALAAVREGRATPQDAASQAVVAVLDPRPGERVADLAAAPGGKATGAAERMGDDGTVVAVDLHPGRARTVARAAARLGLDRVLAVAADGRHPPLRAGAFDRVLLDAPCSGLGVLRRRPDARWRVQPGDVARLAALQRDLLAAAATLVRPGGVLAYSVCTLTAEETVEIDRWAAAALPGWQIGARPGPPWRPHGRGALVLPPDAGTDGMFVLAGRVG